MPSNPSGVHHKSLNKLSIDLNRQSFNDGYVSRGAGYDRGRRKALLEAREHFGE